MSRNVPNVWVDSLGEISLWHCLFAVPGLAAVLVEKAAVWLACRFHVRDRDEPQA